MKTQGSQGGGDPQTLGDVRLQLIKDIEVAKKLGATKELATLKSGLKHIDDLIRSLHASAGGRSKRQSENERA